jgi:hypothetical protein
MHTFITHLSPCHMKLLKLGKSTIYYRRKFGRQFLKEKDFKALHNICHLSTCEEPFFSLLAYSTSDVIETCVTIWEVDQVKISISHVQLLNDHILLRICLVCLGSCNPLPLIIVLSLTHCLSYALAF